MICKSCGKECPEKKFCVFCGAPLLDPNQFFMDIQFSSVQECSQVKIDYGNLTRKFTDSNATYTLADLEESIKACKSGNYHPTASKLALELLEPKAKKLRLEGKTKRVLATGRWITLLYAVVFVAIALTKPIFKVVGNNQTLWGMVTLLTNSDGMGTYTWFWNFIVVLVFIALICTLISSAKEKTEAVAAPFVVTIFLGILWIINLIFGFLGLDYRCASGFYWILGSSLIFGIANFII